MPGAVGQGGLSIPQGLSTFGATTDGATPTGGIVGTLFPEVETKNFSKCIDVAEGVTYKLNSVFPASKGQLEAANTALIAKNNQQDVIINHIVLQVNALTPVSIWTNNQPKNVSTRACTGKVSEIRISYPRRDSMVPMAKLEQQVKLRLSA